MGKKSYLLDKDKVLRKQKMLHAFIENAQAFQELLNCAM